jgi:hypothetical protein
LLGSTEPEDDLLEPSPAPDVAVAVAVSVAVEVGGVAITAGKLEVAEPPRAPILVVSKSSSVTLDTPIVRTSAICGSVGHDRASYSLTAGFGSTVMETICEIGIVAQA